MKYFIYLSLLNSPVLFAAGGSRDKMQLFWGAVLNFSILLIAFLLKGRPALKSYFVGKHEDIKSTSERALIQKNEAEIKLESQLKKNNELPQLLEGINQDLSEEIHAFEKSKKEESSKQLINLEKDSASKVENTKNEILNKINNELIDEIITIAKKKVGNNPELQRKVSESLSKGL